MNSQRLSSQWVPLVVVASTNLLACYVATGQQQKDLSRKVEKWHVLSEAKTALKFRDGT